MFSCQNIVGTYCCFYALIFTSVCAHVCGSLCVNVCMCVYTSLQEVTEGWALATSALTCAHCTYSVVQCWCGNECSIVHWSAEFCVGVVSLCYFKKQSEHHLCDKKTHHTPYRTTMFAFLLLRTNTSLPLRFTRVLVNLEWKMLQRCEVYSLISSLANCR